jgi:hypothetical protein
MKKYMYRTYYPVPTSADAAQQSLRCFRDCSGGLAEGNAVTSLKEALDLVWRFVCVYVGDIPEWGFSGCSGEVVS